MTQIFTPDRRVFIHDFDGVHYAYADFPDMRAFLAVAKATAAAELLPDLDYDTAYTMGLESFHKTGNGQLLFVQHAEKLGRDMNAFKRDFHLLMHKIAAQNALRDRAHVFTPVDAINVHFDRLQGQVRHGLLTQSCLTNWAKPLLTAQNRLQYFEEGALFGYAETGYLTKAESSQPLQKIMAAMNAAPGEVVFIEDSLPNLERAKELDPHIFTVYTCHGEPLESLPAYVDLQTQTLDTLFAMADIIYSTGKAA